MVEQAEYERARTAFEYHVSRLGEPRRTRIPYETYGETVVSDGANNWHPVFDLQHRFVGDYEKGYSANPHRGEHLCIPLWSEQGTFAVVELSFHKGHVAVEWVEWPQELPHSDEDDFGQNADSHRAHYGGAMTVLDENYGF